MKLSDAIRKEPRYPQAFSVAIQTNQDGTVSLCAMTTAIRNGWSYSDATKWIERVSCDGACDAKYWSTRRPEMMVIHLNDQHWMTFDQIADWLDARDADEEFNKIATEAAAEHSLVRSEKP